MGASGAVGFLRLGHDSKLICACGLCNPQYAWLAGWHLRHQPVSQHYTCLCWTRFWAHLRLWIMQPAWLAGHRPVITSTYIHTLRIAKSHQTDWPPTGYATHNVATEIGRQQQLPARPFAVIVQHEIITRDQPSKVRGDLAHRCPYPSRSPVETKIERKTKVLRELSLLVPSIHVRLPIIYHRTRTNVNWLIISSMNLELCQFFLESLILKVYHYNYFLTKLVIFQGI